MNYTQRYSELNTVFRFGQPATLVQSGVSLVYGSFTSKPQRVSIPDHPVVTDCIKENESFMYPIFLPQNSKGRWNSAIVLLHGLNERFWNKYLVWAEYLSQSTGKPVILFPLAYHMNRSPETWVSPRAMKPLMDLRRQRNGPDRSLSFANIAFSERISDNPLRFYISGCQSIRDLENLLVSIDGGFHPLFRNGARVDLFAYSIGAFVAQVALLSDTKGLLSDSRLFMFCGGSVFSAMYGESRSIMDRNAYLSLYQYYLHQFSEYDKPVFDENKSCRHAFYTMITEQHNKVEREMFFSSKTQRIQGISLVADKVIPYAGVVEALGKPTAESCIELLDFAYDYSHENPFPVVDVCAPEVDCSFNTVFCRAADFLSD